MGAPLLMGKTHHNRRSMKSMKKYTLVFFLIIGGFLCGCATEYHDHFFSYREHQASEYASVGDFTSSGEVITFPRMGNEDFLVTAIENAQQKIWIEIYSWTKIESLYTAIRDAKMRGVDVRVVLEGNVYGFPAINRPMWEFLESNNIPVTYADNEQFTFTHAKFWIIDQEYFISTGNWTQSFFKKNREYIYRGSDVTTREFLEKIFQRDYDWKGFYQTAEIPPHMVMSPLNSREKIQQFIRETEEEILVYVQTVTDTNIIAELEAMVVAGKAVTLCTADSESNREAAEKTSLEWKFAKNPYLHAKILLRDEGYVFLGSQNFTTNSLENNREVGILLENRLDISLNIRKDISEHCDA